MPAPVYSCAIPGIRAEPAAAGELVSQIAPLTAAGATRSPLPTLVTRPARSGK